MRRMPVLLNCSALTWSGVFPCALANCSISCCIRSVSVVPGWMTLMLTSSRLPRPTRPFEKLAKAALTEPPTRNSGPGVRAAPPMMLTMLPCAAFRSGQNSRVMRTAPKNLSAKPSVHVSSASVRKSPPRVAPALLMSTSQRPKRALTSAWTCSQPLSVRRSAATVIGGGPPAAATTFAPSDRLAGFDAASTVCAPSRAKAAATARPMPRLPPVTTTTLPVNSFAMRCPLLSNARLIRGARSPREWACPPH